MKEKSESYKQGYRNGHMDRLLNLEALQVSLHNSDKEYANGYKAGYFATLKEYKKESYK